MYCLWDRNKLGGRQGCPPLTILRWRARAESGTQNETLNKAAFKLGWQVVAGSLDRGEVERWLLHAAYENGSIADDGEEKAKATIRRGLDDGEREARNDFARNHNGSPIPSQANIRLAMEKLGIRVRYDVFGDRAEIEGLEGVGPALDDDAMARLWLLIDERFRFRPARDFFWTVVGDDARRNSFHPVIDYLGSLNWDGIPRVDTWLSTYGGAEDTPYTRAVSALMLIAAVRRVREPGVKFDEMPVLESDQGKEKSSALEALAVREEWFSADLPLNIDTQKTIERVAGCWIIEAAELKGMRKGEVEHVKSFLSRRVDRARMAYGRLPKESPRQFIIVDTTNSDRYLRDTTGNRRFWPVKVGQFDLGALKRDRDQLWAEAASREARGESTRMDRALWDAAAEEQEDRRVEDPWEGLLREALGEREGKVRAADVWTIVDVTPDRRTQDHNERLGSAMRRLGWERTKARFSGGSPEHGYVRGEGERRILVNGKGLGALTYYEGDQEPM